MSDHITKFTADIVTAFVGSNAMVGVEIHGLINTVHKALVDAGANVPETGPESHSQQPAVDPKKSVFKNHILCLEDGKSFKMLKRHLATDHNMTPEQYRTKWGLPYSFPMVAPAYAATRSALAKESGLGHSRPKKPGKKGKR